MKLIRIRTILLVPLVLFGLFYLTGVVLYATREIPEIGQVESPEAPLKIAIFGASGTAGDGILKAALASAEIGEILVVTRRETPRMAEGVESGKVQMIVHMDYRDYSAIQSQFTDVDTVFWAIGVSSLGVDEETYGMIHVDFPMQFVKAWTDSNNNPDLSFHFISSSDISEDSTTMWIRQKIRAEKTMFAFAESTPLRVIAYRPDYIGPTTEQAHLGQELLYWFFRPVGAAVRATQIGYAMIDIGLRGAEYVNGSKISTGKIVQHSDAFIYRIK